MAARRPPLLRANLGAAAVTVDAANVYSVAAVMTGGRRDTHPEYSMEGGMATTLFTGGYEPELIAVDSTTIYWVSGGTAMEDTLDRWHGSHALCRSLRDDLRGGP